jgi:glycosyltransferase involved in cell wall biosynthesis
MVANGWDGDKTSPCSKKKELNKLIQGALDADVIVFQRPDQPQHVEIAKLLQEAGKKVVFDNDDTYIPESGIPTMMKGMAGEDKLKKMHDSLNDFMKTADLCTTTTEFLAEEYKLINPNTVVLPNMVDPDDWDEPLPNDTDKVRIGLIGSVSSNENYAPIKPLLDHYENDDRVQFVLLGIPRQVQEHDFIRDLYKEEMEFWGKRDVEWHHFVPQEDYNELLNELKLDIMLIPRHDSYFNRAKSNLKFLEASMLEIPVVAQGFKDGKAPYQGKDEDYMEVIVDNEDWIKTVEELVVNKSLRESMGKKAHEYVLKHYNINDHGNQWYNVYKKLLD